VTETFDSWPYAATFLLFFASAMVRSHLTYWAGRGLRAGGERTELSRHLDRPAVAAAERFVRRVGAPAVTLSFLTVGFQTAVIAASGALRMPLTRFEPAAVVGSLVWAAVYTTVGFAVVEAWLTGSAGSWLLLVVGLAAVVWVTTVLVARRVGRRRDDVVH
jgi:membrane protein DedA with SNARE-associated domain